MNYQIKKIIFVLSLLPGFGFINCAAPTTFDAKQAIQKINDSIGQAQTLLTQPNNFDARVRYFNGLTKYLTETMNNQGCPGFGEQIKKQTIQKMDETAFAISTFALENVQNILSQVQKCLQEAAYTGKIPISQQEAEKAGWRFNLPCSIKLDVGDQVLIPDGKEALIPGKIVSINGSLVSASSFDVQTVQGTYTILRYYIGKKVPYPTCPAGCPLCKKRLH